MAVPAVPSTVMVNPGACPPMPTMAVTDNELQECRNATDQLQEEIVDLKEQIESAKRTNSAMADVMQSMNRQVQRLSSDVNYYKSESERREDITRRQIQAEREMFDQLQQMLQSGSVGAQSPLQPIPPLDPQMN
ncbi:MAG: hypothetical protein R3C20_20045 [Planctomycetaceae bacterium]